MAGPLGVFCRRLAAQLAFLAAPVVGVSQESEDVLDDGVAHRLRVDSRLGGPLDAIGAASDQLSMRYLAPAMSRTRSHLEGRVESRPLSYRFADLVRGAVRALVQNVCLHAQVLLHVAEYRLLPDIAVVRVLGHALLRHGSRLANILDHPR